MMTRRWLGFGTLCLLSGSIWIADEYRPTPISGLLRIAIHQAVLALLFAMCGALFRSKELSRPTLRLSLQLGLYAIPLMVLPSALIVAAGGHVSSLTEVLVFMLVPIVVIFLHAQRNTSFGPSDNPLQIMLPALIALGGAGLLIPFTAPASVAGKLWLGAMVIGAGLAGLAADRLHPLLLHVEFTLAATIFATSSSITSAAFCWIAWSPPAVVTLSTAAVELIRILLFDAPSLLLTLWLLCELRPIAFSARYFLIPMITLSEGLVLMRPEITWTIVAGTLLMLGGSLALLRPDSREMP